MQPKGNVPSGQVFTRLSGAVPPPPSDSSFTTRKSPSSPWMGESLNHEGGLRVQEVP